MPSPRPKLLVVDIAALGWSAVSHLPEFQPTQTVFPAVTCTVQASFRTAAAPQAHGMVGNGLFFRDLRKVLFWEQSASLVQGPRIWDDFRARGKKVGLMFWQQSMGEAVDLIATPAPIHKHSGGMIQDCYTQPPELQEHLREAIGRPFNLMNYWGPLANHRSSDWIVDATITTMGSPEFSPDLLLTYIPHLDYDLQRWGPNSDAAQRSLDLLLGYLTRLKAACADFGYNWLIFGDYAMEPVKRGAVFPNRRLREAGLFAHREIRGMAYTDFFTSRAFAVVDHQCAHVYCRDAESIAAARTALADLPGVAEVLDRAAQAGRGLAHANSGDLILVAETGAWFAYPWFSDKKEAPDYATHVDIHNKPGYDPCELFFGWPPGSVSMDTTKIHGSHGNIGAGYEIAWSTSLELAERPQSLLDLARATQNWMAGCV
ncbi:MAG TPA: nucleotide pyrophosphatase/phosphodiesterase family protein [Chthoniobacteraceae bacterium]|jgi:predicted AlkP superfamily pyrophosphatase or phosphodiesterase|nr:nucleotide pyrophosphatase/phosphodiesterase family protein [Chthoniobacteraceae bacterium]